MNKSRWFKKAGWFHSPLSWQGWLIWILTFLFMVNVFWVVDGFAHSASDTLYGIFPYWIPTILLVEWIASKTSK